MNFKKFLLKKGMDDQGKSLSFWYVSTVNGGLKAFMTLMEKMIRKML